MTDLEARPDRRADLLWLDGLGGLAAGTIVLSVHDWLASLYGLPGAVLLFVGSANLAYGATGTLLARTRRRPPWAIAALAMANMSWPLACLGIAVTWASTVSWLGHAHLGLEAVYVGALGLVEWRWRHHLVRRHR